MMVWTFLYLIETLWFCKYLSVLIVFGWCECGLTYQFVIWPNLLGSIPLPAFLIIYPLPSPVHDSRK